MSITFQSLYNQIHQFSEGVVNINSTFEGNVIALSVTTKPEYLANSQVIGYLYQFYGEASKGYAIKSGKDIIRLELPETDSLSFIPTNFLSGTYVLDIDYAIVGAVVDGSNTVSIPSVILALPASISQLETQVQRLVEDLADIEVTPVTWETITGKPSSFSPSTHIHEIIDITGLNTVLDDHEVRLNTLESNPVSSSSSIAYERITLNQVLETNTAYIADASNLICTLPVNPSIGDAIHLFNTNNSSFRVNHGNTSQTILNNTTQTLAGIDSGIILKPYSAIDLVSVANDLWVSRNKNRQINNYSPFSLETLATKKTYTATSDNFVRRENTLIPSIYNGVKQPTGSFPTDGVLHGSNSLNLLITTSEAIILDSIDMFVGQGNSGLNTPSEYTVTALTVYRGNSTSGVNLGTFTFTNSTGVQQSRNIVNSEVSNTYFIVVTGSGGQVGILELELLGRGAGGGEVVVT